MNVLYVNHTGAVSGGEHSLLELFAGLPSSISPTLACPGGDLEAAAHKAGVPVWSIGGTELTLSLHPFRTPRGLADLVRTAVSVRDVAKKSGAQLVHANSIRAGLIAVLASRVGAPPAIVHIRDCLPAGAAGELVRRFVKLGATLVLANSRYTAERFARNMEDERVRVVYASVDTRLFDPAQIDRDQARASLGLDSSSPVLGVVAQLTPWKGQDDAIRSLALLRELRPDAELLLVGEAKFQAARYDNAAFEGALHRLAADLGVADGVRFLGERRDIPEVLRALDVVLVPSWEEPFGRTVIEAMAMERAVMATAVGGPAEIIRDGEDGLVLPPRDPQRWAKAADGLLSAPRLRARMGREARLRVMRDFGREGYVEAILDAYTSALTLRPAAQVPRRAARKGGSWAG